MFGFFFKKNFADIWDNLFHLIVVNIVMLVLAGGLLMGGLAVAALPLPAGPGTLAAAGYALAACMVLGVALFAEGENAAKMANFESVRFSAYFRHIPGAAADGIRFGLLAGFLVVVAVVSIPYYFSLWIPADGGAGSPAGLALMALVFWFEVLAALVLQWFLPVRSLMHDGFRKCLKKSLILFFDNTGFTLLLAFLNLLHVALTVFTLGLLPGLHGITLTNTNALRLRLYKYDWLEVNPGLSARERRDVPWDELLANDRRTLGPRGWKSFIFPWKD